MLGVRNLSSPIPMATGIKITVEILEAAYALVAETEPFCSWPLPDVHEVRFEIKRFRAHTADSFKDATGRWTIRMNDAWCGSLHGVVATMMHEMCHLAHGEACPSDQAHHGKWFKALANAVCSVHPLDPKSF